ncbi:hypothetical protein [Pontibacter cellulosilyticus]|uniref:Uncharacterized protein n=1 Tax=Pontibacter cellulosilyticus TaxID=1720253 RepID=A0A923SI73_9BACT|nr:hypothetical protein [Pontibacter cellulosilyticus]MBC5992453.1 hypothetical protein [Pontibacter cellulosilyticus]
MDTATPEAFRYGYRKPVLLSRLQQKYNAPRCYKKLILCPAVLAATATTTEM